MKKIGNIDVKIWKRVLSLAIPAMLGQVATIIYNLADTFFVALTKDPNQIAAVTVSLPIFVIIMAIGTIFALGGCSMITRAFGAGEKKKTREITSFAIYAMILTGVLVAVLGLLFLKPLAGVAGADADNMEFTITYLRYIFWGAPLILVGNGMVFIFRGHNLANQSAVGLILGNVVNVVLDYVFIILLNMGTAGAAIATSLGYGAGCVYFAIYAWKVNRNGYKCITLNPKSLRPTAKLFLEMVKTGIPGALMTILICIATMVMNNYVALYGSAAVAAYGIAIKLNNIGVNLGNGLAQGVAPRFGFCYGANNRKELSATIRVSLMFGILCSLLFLAVFVLLGEPLSGLFLDDPVLIHQAYIFLVIMASTTFAATSITIFASYFQTIGKAMPSTAIVVAKNVVVFVPAVMILNRFFGLSGVIFALPVADCITLLFSALVYKKEK